jgi:hypothetical protein
MGNEKGGILTEAIGKVYCAMKMPNRYTIQELCERTKIEDSDLVSIAVSELNSTTLIRDVTPKQSFEPDGTQKIDYAFMKMNDIDKQFVYNVGQYLQKHRECTIAEISRNLSSNNVQVMVALYKLENKK